MMRSLFLYFVTSKMDSNLYNNLPLGYCQFLDLSSTFPTQFESPNLASKCQSYGQNNITGRDKRIQFRLFGNSPSLGALALGFIINRWLVMRFRGQTPPNLIFSTISRDIITIIYIYIIWFHMIYIYLYSYPYPRLYSIAILGGSG